MGKINYVLGDATTPNTDGNKIIAHICNDVGGWGAGFVLAVSKRFKEPENAYAQWYKRGTDFKLGNIQLVYVAEDLYVANMIGQKGIEDVLGIPPIRYNAVGTCLEKLSIEAAKLNASIHMPRIGCGLAGGKWEEIEPIIIAALVEKGIEVYVYDYK